MPGEAPKATTAPVAASASGRLDALMAAVREAGGRGPAPVEKWDPPDCGDMDLVIKADGSWHYMGTPIGRPALVRLFASVLTRDGERYVLKTPVEKVGIRVEDAPFLAVEMAVEDAADGRTLVFRTNLDDLVRCGPGHALRFAPGGAPGEVVPYVHVRRGLDARLTRAVHLDLMGEGEVRAEGGVPMFGVGSAGVFFPILPAADLGLEFGADVDFSE
ncbi:DUF1285 domain-containing protein [Xanthobacter versatilis]|uniref:DUF1285 domain-containing protein n=1 Tax=Xanthobacter autotrophicus (strain ATCC BAA-1158 / Py2) TaxID=78245 RepID=A7IJJ2_XANP2|nr:protein of unknown function DUF1285 [Xanthobacter autotrophicus Py2]